MSGRIYPKVQAQQKTLSGASSKSRPLQRICACGQRTIAAAECSMCCSEQSKLLPSQRAFKPPSAFSAEPGNSPSQENGTSFDSALDRASRFGYSFGRIPVHSPATGTIQAKLAINTPGDEYEQEADRISQQVMRTPEPQLQGACACGGARPQCRTEQPAQGYERLQTKPVGSGDLGQTVVPPAVDEVISGPGQPLDTAARAFMEPRFGYDFSQVRVHTGDNVAASMKAVGALAYAHGNDVFFGSGRYSSHTYEGRSLLAHELAHVVQQQFLIPQNDSFACSDAVTEVEAERAAAGSPNQADVAVIWERGAGAIQLKPDGDVKPTEPTLIKLRADSTDRIEDAYVVGSLGETQWRNLLDSAEQAFTNGQSDVATRDLLILYADVAKLAQASRVVRPAGVINVVTGSKGNCRDAKPGLNFTLGNSDQWGANASTSWVDDQGKFGVPLKARGALQPEVAIVLSRSVFKREKEQTLGILRHEMIHAEQDMEDAAKALLSSPKDKSDPVMTSAANAELLGYVEGFMTMFHLTHPAPTSSDHPAFVELLGALDTGHGEVFPWAEADPPVRSEALGRLQEYYCHALDRPHREAFEEWVGHGLTKARIDRLISGPRIKGKSSSEVFSESSSKVFSPGSVDDKRLEVLQAKGDMIGAVIRMTRIQDFYHALQGIITGKCKGLTTAMKI